ncbi:MULTISPECIES: pseudouridine synthase [Thalassolituus]|jgi:16S rRNA pseudouridine516 synthase|uniref:pseudouridine synthase n=1 Tax=Thalassolituus TaxID=187492 RepID=UPI000C661CC7|nr:MULTISPECIES: 16S rRNA pseudouridine(516) synthase [Thalassolituus]MAX85688.1 16S rRNA pseudouridine(516) synthase [Oceanospirillaceae bacterium]MEE3209904.1 16S rRNA pseudouridine(516) synthase [Pseudomonadota bacterium]TPD55885.1 MAG: 16S rRNA pseudouridine(516) synthase [Thalassolituus maritimus]|tara:strand:+ start:47 stop:763 length:717 start_codon:yes stop_codon:yes gene_type:complete
MATAKRYRLDRFLSVTTGTPKRSVRSLLAQNRVTVDGRVATDINQPVDHFSRITLDGKELQNRTRRYVLLHKPVGVVSATIDDIHPTVIDVLRDAGFPEAELCDMHIAGRLDLNSSGLLLLTNDSDWSEALMAPDRKVAKVYEVTLENPISDECVKAFKEGIYFSFEGITTKPATLERLTPYTGTVTLTEGKYHQIKRMFGHFRNPVLRLHRVAIGDIRLDASLKCGEYRAISNISQR